MVVHSFRSREACMCQLTMPSLVQIMVFCLPSAIIWTNAGLLSWIHPSLWWLCVFSLFPPRPLHLPLPCPPPQQLLPLTSKTFQLNLRYMAQRIYRSGEMYWMTFPWPSPKVTAVASISKNLLACTIKWEPLITSQQSMAALLPYYVIRFWRSSVTNF